jgi:hypothetical protein
MSIEAIRAVWEHSNQRGEALLVLQAMADFADVQGIAWPSAETLAKKSRLSRQSTWNIIKRLKASGEIVLEQQGGGRGRMGATGRQPGVSNRYRITLLDRQSKSHFTSTVGNLTVGKSNSHFGTTNSHFGREQQSLCMDGIYYRSIIDPSLKERAANACQPPLSRRIKAAAKIVRREHKRSSSPKTLLPADFTLTPELRDFAVAVGRDPDMEIKRFRADALAEGRTHLNWDKAFEKWCLSPYGRDHRQSTRRGLQSVNAKDIEL